MQVVHNLEAMETHHLAIANKCKLMIDECMTVLNAKIVEPQESEVIFFTYQII